MPCRLRDDLRLARVCPQLEQRLPRQVALEDERPSVRAARVQIVECEAEPAQGLLAQGGDDVEAVCELVRAMENATEAAAHPPARHA